MKGYSTSPKLQDWSLTSRNNLISYPGHLMLFSTQLTLSQLFGTFKIKRSGVCLPQEQFKEYSRDNHIGARALHDQPTDQVGLLWLPVSPCKGWSRVTDCIFEIHQLWQSGFSRVYSNSCSSCSFEPEIIKIGQSSHKMYSVTANWLKSQTGLYFRTCEDGAGWHLIPYGISPRSEFFYQAYTNWHITWGINLGPDWPPLARGSKFHTITHPPGRFLPSPRLWKNMDL